ncbi:MAG: hypothetical protein ACXVQQ_02790 [Gaiellaceae bacterium]
MVSTTQEAMVETVTEERVDEQHVEAQWERAECACPDWCERDHELD